MNGVVFVQATGFDPTAELPRVIRDAMREVENGRCLVVTWFESFDQPKRHPMESIAVRAVIGSPKSSKRGDGEWLFFGNGSVRLFRRKGSRPHGVCFWVAFRKAGDKAFTRRHSVSHEISAGSEIDVQNPVFTRDAANNVWHMQDNCHCRRVLNRLQSLLTWSDEMAIVYSVTGRRRMRRRPRDLSDDLIGVPTKVPYDWGERLFEMI